MVSALNTVIGCGYYVLMYDTHPLFSFINNWLKVWNLSGFEFESHSGEVYSIQHNVIMFVSDLWQVGGFLQGTPVSSTNKTDHYDITEILLKVA
jgi:hypothetical protein